MALLALTALLLAAAWARPPEYDEAYSIFLTAGHARPAWPTGIFTAASVRHVFAGQASFSRIAHDLRAGDVHPPLYFWALEIWRRLTGPSWFAARLLSVGFTVAGLATLARLAALAKLPVLAVLLVAGLSYGFAYTGIVARGFALAQWLNIVGAVLVFPQGGARRGFAGGLAFGAASFTNYLASFTGFAFILWLFAGLQWRRGVAAGLGFLLFLPADGWFFLGQRTARIGQFTAFHLLPALKTLMRDAGAALFGGLPAYAGAAGPAVAVALLVLALACAAFAFRNRRKNLMPFLVAGLATPAGLIGLGLLFDNTPIEIRYLAFALPWAALLLATLPRKLLGVLLAVEALGFAGLCLAPQTMQPQGLAARAGNRLAPGTLILVPKGNDGVGIPGPFIAAAPDAMPILLIRPEDLPNLILPWHFLLARIGVDDASRTTIGAFITTLNKDACFVRKNSGSITIVTRICAPLQGSHPSGAP